MNQHDLDLVQRIKSGSVEAWHDFIDRYSSLIYSVIVRYHFDPDDVQGAFVDTLDTLYRGRLYTYNGTAALSTWLVHTVRSAAIDHLRKRWGRHRLPKGLKSLGKTATRIFELYYLEGLNLEAVQHRLEAEGERVDHVKVLETLEAIDANVDPHYMRRMAYNLHAESVGAVSGRLLEFLDRTRELAREMGRKTSPEYELMEAEARCVSQEILGLIDRLPQEERSALSLRYHEGLKARQIANRMGFAGQKSVYNLLERALRHIRRLLREEGLGPQG